MTVAQRKVNGEDVWVIDRRFRRKDGVVERYRRAAQVQIKAAAKKEEMEIALVFAAEGSIARLLAPALVAPKKAAVEATKAYTWDDAVDHYRANELPGMKPSAKRSWEQHVSGPYLSRYKGMVLADISYGEMKKWEAWMVTLLPNNGSRRNQHLSLRSTLRSVGPQGPNGEEPGAMLSKLPTFVPLPIASKKSIEVPSDADIELIMMEGRPGGVTLMKHVRALAVKRQQLAFGLSIWAGLRAGEIRALRRADIDVQRKRITIRRSRCCGIETTTKGDDERVVPITDLLWERLEPRLSEMKRGPNEHVAVNHIGNPWGDYGVYWAFVRTCRRLAIMDSRFHACRHFFATHLFGYGASAVTVMKALGHKDLVTTLRYSHYQPADLDRAISGFSPKLAAE